METVGRKFMMWVCSLNVQDQGSRGRGLEVITLGIMLLLSHLLFFLTFLTIK